jgi:probable F420-dependent oxidoreductase
VTDRPFRFGLSASDARAAPDWVTLAQRVEVAGFDVLLQSDHLVPTLSPFSSLAVAAAVTERLRVGTLVLNNDLRHPVITAREAASLDVLAGGRMELGLGAGHMRSEYDEVGLRFDNAGTRVDRLEEAVSIIRRLLDGETVDHIGDHYRITGHRVGYGTVQPRMPLLVGGNGDRVLTLAARVADIVGFVGFGHREADTSVQLTHFTLAGLSDRVDLVRHASGPRFGDIELNVLVQRVELTDDPEAVAAPLVGRFDGATIDDVVDSPFLLIGTVDDLVAKLHRLRSELGITYFACFEAALEPMAEVIAALE